MSETKQAMVRSRVATLFDAGHSPEEIGRMCGMASERVEQILDLIERAPAPVAPAAEPMDKPRRRAAAPCGQVAAYQAHYARGEKPCDPCKVAFNAHQRDLRAARRARSVAAGQTSRAALVGAESSAEPPAVKVRERIRWLIPRGAEPNQVPQYAIATDSGALARFRLISDEEAEERAARGERIFARYVTPWVDAR